MRVAILSPLFESVPPRCYGGTERVVANICRGLVELGHDVTLFSSGDSTSLAKVVATCHHALRLSPTPVLDPNAFHVAQLGAICRRLQSFEVIHNHMDYLGFPLALLSRTPVVSTLHGRLDHPDTRHVLGSYPEIPLVSISDAQRRPVPEQNWVATVYHGLPLDDFRFYPHPGTYLAFLGRISPEKRPDLAIDIARAAGVPLKIAAKVDAADQDYFKRVIKPRLDGRDVEYLGEIGEAEKSRFLGEALGLLFPIDWPEPFGLVQVEAWATGTPVLARPYGSVPELHVDGVTGFVRESAADLAALVPGLVHFDRARCRAHVERCFSLRRMCEDYVDVYRAAKPCSRKSGPVQPGQPDGRQRGFLHPVVGLVARDQQDRIERQ